jgi:hypothetical protein
LGKRIHKEKQNEKKGQKQKLITGNMAPTFQHMKLAAVAVSGTLTDNGIRHAFIGGFALQMLGHERDTLDIDVYVDIENPDEMRRQVSMVLCHADPRFAVLELKLFFLPEMDWDLRIPIETLPRGLLGLPRTMSTMHVCDGE